MAVKTILGVFALTALGTIASAKSTHNPAPARFGAQDLVRLQRISDPVAAPDGIQVTYTLRSTDIAANKGRTSIWLVENRKHAVARRLTDPLVSANSSAWSADSRYVYYLATQNGTTQIWRISPTAGNPEQITHLPLDVGSFRLSPSGDVALVSLEVYPDCADLACSHQRLETVSKSASSGMLYDHLFVRHWDTWGDARRAQLFSLPIDGHSPPIRLTDGSGDVPSKPFGGREDYGFSPDGKQVVFSLRVAGKTEPWSTNFDIYTVSVEGGTARNLTAGNPAWDGQPAFSPDGSTLAYVAMDRAGFEADRFHLVLLDLKTGVKQALTQNWDRSITSFAWQPNGKALIAATDHLGQHPLWSIDAITGRAAAITGAGKVESFSIGTGKVFYTLSTLGSPADLYAVGLSGGKATQMTRVNDSILAQRKLGEYEQFNFEGWNHENVYGYVVKPPEFKRHQKYPVAFVIHGGPQGSLGNSWHYRWNAQSFAAAGYAVVMIDFHGSTGYGQAFTDSISKDWGGKPLDDLKLGLDAALKEFPWLDGEHMCALGGSYGGFMVNWIAGQWPDRFKCLVSHSGIFDQRSMYYSTEELWFNEWENGGAEFQNPKGYAQFNPVDFITRWKTPTLVIHGQLDYRVPYTQGVSVFTALQRRGIPSEFLFFPDENHWILKPANSVLWYDKVLSWMDQWTRP